MRMFIVYMNGISYVAYMSSPAESAVLVGASKRGMFYTQTRIFYVIILFCLFWSSCAPSRFAQEREVALSV